MVTHGTLERVLVVGDAVMELELDLAWITFHTTFALKSYCGCLMLPPLQAKFTLTLPSKVTPREKFARIWVLLLKIILVSELMILECHAVVGLKITFAKVTRESSFHCVFQTLMNIQTKHGSRTVTTSFTLKVLLPGLL